MKKIIISILLCISFPLLILAQKDNFYCFLRGNSDICIYPSEISLTPLCTVRNDTINELYPYIEILENSELRFYVQVTEYSDPSTPYRATIGWIDKQYCGGYVLNNEYNSNGEALIYLYEQPSIKSNYEIITGDITDAAVLINIVEENNVEFAKVLFSHNGRTYIGYVTRLCRNIYKSCN